MILRGRTVGALAMSLGLAIAACGGSAEPDRLSLTTPRAPASSTPEPARTPVTDAEKRVIRGWADEMRRGRVAAAAKYFSVPSEIVNLPPKGNLISSRQVEEFNDSMPCGAKLLGVQRTVSELVVADFELTNRPGAECGASAGERATFAFLIDADDHIARFILIDGSAPTAPGGDGVASA